VYVKVFALLSFFSFAFADLRKPDENLFQVKTLSTSPEIYFIENFFSLDDCDHLKKKAMPHLKRSTVVDETGHTNGVVHQGRTSSGMFFSPFMQDPVVTLLEEKIARLTNTPKKNGEWIQVMRYQPEEEYLPHYDFFDPNTSGGRDTLLRGGQRIATCILYLEEPQKGGETIFPYMMISVFPKKGGLLLFYNCNEKNEVDLLTFHGSAPVIEGEKWIATRWIRQNTFR
jgi:prolyl 4-hydroxylase